MLVSVSHFSSCEKYTSTKLSYNHKICICSTIHKTKAIYTLVMKNPLKERVEIACTCLDSVYYWKHVFTFLFCLISNTLYCSTCIIMQLFKELAIQKNGTFRHFKKFILWFWYILEFKQNADDKDDGGDSSDRMVQNRKKFFGLWFLYYRVFSFLVVYVIICSIICLSHDC